MELKNQDNRSSDNLYLEKLTFKPELRKTWLNFFVSNFRVVILLILMISAWGVYSYIILPRESMPEVKIPIAVVITTYPGVSPSDMEELVTKKIENSISSVKGISKITSNSRNSVSSIIVEFNASEDADDVIRKLRDQVTTAKKDLPKDASEPTVNQISLDDTPILTVALSGPFDGFTLKDKADDIKDELEKLPDVREVLISGGDEREFEVAYDPQKLTFYGITPSEANQLIAAVNIAVPSGSFDGKSFTYPVRTDSKFYDANKLASTPIGHTENANIIYLKDIASVSEKAIKKTVYSRFSIERSEPQSAVTIDLVKKTGGNVVKTVDSAAGIIEKMSKSFPQGMRYDIVTDYAKEIRTDFDQLSHDFLLTLMLVFGLLFLIVGLKEAFVAGMAVPLVFFVTFGVMQISGISLNFLSIFSLILSLGLLVDDAIVVVSATKQYLRTGKFTPEEAVLLVLNDFKVVLTTTTLTTVWAFLPLLWTSGIMGEFIKSIPITVSVTLLSSLLIALMVNHPLAAVLERVRLTKKIFYLLLGLLFSFSFYLIWLNSAAGYIFTGIFFVVILTMIRWYMKGGNIKMEQNAVLAEKEWENDDLIKEKLRLQGLAHKENFSSRLIHGIINFNAVLPYYDKYLRIFIKNKKLSLRALGIVFAIFIGAVMLPASGIVPSEFFPPSNNTYVFINVRGATGLTLDETDKITKKIEEKLLKYEEIINFSTTVGGSNTGGGYGVSGNSSNLSSFVINLTETKERKITSYELSEKIREDLSDIKEATISVESPKGGPPSGKSFEARIVGDDLQKLDSIAKDLKPYLTSIKGVVDADISLKDSPAEYTFTLDSAKMELYYLNSAYVGSALRMAISGSEVTTVIRNGKEIKVVARFDKNKIPTLESIQNIQLINLAKQPVFIKDVAKVELRPSVENISRIDQKRAVLLSANVTAENRATAVLKEFKKNISSSYELPEDYEIIYGGENEQNNESIYSIIRAMLVAIILIIVTLVIQFNSFKQASIVIMTIPLALIGVFIGMAITGVNLSFPGLIGILALFGIVVKNAIILIDKINLNIKAGIEFDEAIIDAGKSRLEAIFITSVCTILGIIPITFSNELWRALGSAVIFGLVLSSFFTLFVIPMLFKLLIKNKQIRDQL